MNLVELLPESERTGDIKQTLEAKNVVIRQATMDAQLKPSIIEFATDGSTPVVAARVTT
jgi:hypothetical protein